MPCRNKVDGPLEVYHIRAVMDRAGHKRLSMSTTMRYLRVSPSKNPVKRIKFRD